MEMEAILFKSRGKFNIEQKDIVGNMRNCLNFMDESIREFNEFYSSDRTKTNFYPAKEIEGVIQLLSAKTLFAEAEIVRHMDEYITIKGHKNAFANICMILLDNALDIFKAREISRGTIFVELFLKNDGNTILKVSDNGGGIKVKPIDSIFNVFMNSEKDGSGLGLAMAKVLVEQKLNGRIKAYNDSDKAVFEIEFGAYAEFYRQSIPII
jgi:signal transduction histidine kinase